MKSRYIEWRRENIYRNYVCDRFKLQGERKYISANYSDIVNPKPKVSSKEAMKTAIDTLKKSGVTIL